MSAKGQGISVEVSGQTWVWNGSTLHGRHGISSQTLCLSQSSKIIDLHVHLRAVDVVLIFFILWIVLIYPLV